MLLIPDLLDGVYIWQSFVHEKFIRAEVENQDYFSPGRCSEDFLPLQFPNLHGLTSFVWSSWTEPGTTPTDYGCYVSK